MTEIIILVFTLTLLFTGCIEDTTTVKENTDVLPENTINADSVKDYDTAAANNAFAFDMYSQLTQPGTGEYENIFFSS